MQDVNICPSANALIIMSNMAILMFVLRSSRHMEILYSMRYVHETLTDCVVRGLACGFGTLED